MARALSSSPLFSSLLSNATAILSRRGYSVAAEAVRRNLTIEEKTAAVSSFIQSKRVNGSDLDSNSWVPDPVTGYYRPANRVVEIDAAELREMLLRRRV
ncbi:hypothetical protein LUZ60_003544 [Juncus effusus]|nr:hypothetical protein LUZ60_003544 [Juncus effusus]